MVKGQQRQVWQSIICWSTALQASFLKEIVEKKNLHQPVMCIIFESILLKISRGYSAISFNSR